MGTHARIISVNPAAITVGERNIAAGVLPAEGRAVAMDHADAPETCKPVTMTALENEAATVTEHLPRLRFFYEHNNRNIQVISNIKRRMRIFFGVSGVRTGLTAPMDSAVFSLRLLFGIFLIAYGLSNGLSAESVIMISAGSLMAAGLFSRLASTVLFVAEVAFAGMAYAAGFDWYINAAIAVGALAVTVLGPGHLSVDSWMQNILQHRIMRKLHNRAIEIRSSYRAYASTL